MKQNTEQNWDISSLPIFSLRVSYEYPIICNSFYLIINIFIIYRLHTLKCLLIAKMLNMK